MREAKGGGIDWFTYMEKVFVKNLQPFVEEGKQDGIDQIVVEDGAGSHAHSNCAVFYSFIQISKIFWPGNSPDLNAIEPCWMWLKKETTKNGPPRTREEEKERWKKTWKELPMAMIRRWVERISEAIKEIIALNGGNEYIECTHGRQNHQRKAGASTVAEVGNVYGQTPNVYGQTSIVYG